MVFNTYVLGRQIHLSTIFTKQQVLLREMWSSYMVAIDVVLKIHNNARSTKSFQPQSKCRGNIDVIIICSQRVKKNCIPYVVENVLFWPSSMRIVISTMYFPSSLQKRTFLKVFKNIFFSQLSKYVRFSFKETRSFYKFSSQGQDLKLAIHQTTKHILA